jgi:hypothetical protein
VRRDVLWQQPALGLEQRRGSLAQLKLVLRQGRFRFPALHANQRLDSAELLVIACMRQKLDSTVDLGSGPDAARRETPHINCMWQPR